MTKKHFEAFAKHIKQRVNEAGSDKQLIARAKAIALAVCEVQDNPNFDRARFMAACGLVDGRTQKGKARAFVGGKEHVGQGRRPTSDKRGSPSITVDFLRRNKKWLAEQFNFKNF